MGRPVANKPLPRSKGPALAVTLTLAGASGLGCASIPRGMAAVDSVDVEGNDAVSDSDVEDKLATTASPRFLEMFQGFIYDYTLFDRNVLQRDIERVERYYRARGYYEARARAGRVNYKSDTHVEVTIEVEEGRPVLLHATRVDGLEGLSPKEQKAVLGPMDELLRRGKPFEEEPFRKAESAMRRALTDRGYAWAKIERRADVDLPRHLATVYFAVRRGPKATFGPIRVEGLGELPEAPVRRAIDISKGDAYSTADLDSAQRAALDLGTFSSVDITPDLREPPPPDAVVPLVVRVQPQKLKSVLLGGGLELDAIRTDVHLRAGWEHKNLFGGFRHFAIDLKPGLVLYPTSISTFQAPTAVLPEVRLRAELRQPGFFEARTNGVIRQEINAYPILLAPLVEKATPAPRQAAPVLGYLEYKGSLGVDRTFWRVLGAPSYNVQYNYPFAYQGKRDPDLRGIVVSYIDLFAHLDYRDSSLRPHAGVYLQNDIQVAGLGGDTIDVRIQPEVRAYVPIGKKVTLAARATMGFLFPMNYGGAARAARDPEADSPSRAAWIRDIETIYLRGFFSGGPSSNRGYPLRGVGPHGVVPFLDPGLQAAAVASKCDSNARVDPKNPNPLPVECQIPLGGLSLWEASLELRFPIAGAFSGSTFCDASDVSPESLDFRFDWPHLSCGLGLRYDTPIGPVRLDAGYRIPGAQLPQGINPDVDGRPGLLLGQPIAIAFGIGEAF